jgi:hypothetical protein
MCQPTLEMRLNDVVHVYIQSNGMDYVCMHYMSIREEYYINKEQRSFHDNEIESESRDT